MSVSNWFDYNAYMTNKLVQVKAGDPTGNWTMDKVAQAFADLGYIGIEGAERHFNDFGQDEDVAPNAFFNATEYYRAKAAHAYNKDVKAVTDADAALVKAAIKGLGMNAWSHYDTFGSSEKVNPSNLFDTEKYMNAKLAALKLVPGNADMKIEDVYGAFSASGLSALEHFMTFGGNGAAGEVTQKHDPKNPAIPSEFAVPEDKKVASGGGASGETFTLTPNVDNFVGETGDDLFIAATVGSVATLTPGDTLDGGAGRDTLKAFAGGGTFAGVAVKNIEVLEINGGYAPLGASPTLDAAQYAGLDTVNFVNAGKLTGAPSSKLTMSNLGDNFTVGFAGATSVTTPGADGFELKFVDTATTANVTTSGLTGNVVVGVAGKGITTLNIKGGMGEAETAALLINKDGTTITAGGANTTINTVNIESTGGQYGLYGSKIATVDASTSTGDLWIDLKVSAGASTAKVIKGGAGDDTVWMVAADVNKGDVIDLGAGEDDMIGFNLTAETAISADQYGVIKAAGAETVGFFGGGGTLAIDASNIGGKDLFFNAGTAPDITVSNISSTQTITSEMHNATNGKLVVVSDKGNLGTVNVVNEGKTDLLKIEGTSANSAFGTLNLSGDGEITVSGSAGSVEINGKDMTGVLDATGSTAKDFIIAGAGGSLITGTTALDEVTFGAGVDTFKHDGTQWNDGSTGTSAINVTTIKSLIAGDKFDFSTANASGAFVSTKLATVTVTDSLDDAVVKAVAAGSDAIVWFTLNDGNTYIAVNASTADHDTTDLIKIQGVEGFDLSKAVYDSASDILTLV